MIKIVIYSKTFFLYLIIIGPIVNIVNIWSQIK